MNKKYVIIGGSKGIGFALVNNLIGKGNHVTVISRKEDQLVNSPLITYIQADVLSPEFSDIVLPEVIDGLAYCPGSIVLKPFKSLSDDQFTEDYNINFIGAVRSIKLALPGLKKSENFPGIVLFSTIAVTQGMPFHTSIASAKGAVEGLVRSLGAELAPGIRVNGIAPSLTKTDLASKILSSPEKSEAAALRHPLKTLGTPEDLASMASFLLSEDAKWISGQILHVDGGMSSLRV